MFDVDNRRGAPVRLKAKLLHPADHCDLVCPGARGIDQDTGLKRFLPGADLPAGADVITGARVYSARCRWSASSKGVLQA
jgi:hypothetical protein